jgi:hypothetical protein
VCS